MSRRTLTTLSPALFLAAALLLGNVAEARRPAWNPAASGSRMSLSQQAGRSYGRQLGNYRDALRAAGRQYDRGQSGQANMERAIGSKVKMLRAQQRGLDAKKEAAFVKAQALEKAGDKAGAEAWLNKAISYESKARSMGKRADRLSNPEFQSKLIKRYEGLRSARSVTSTTTGSAMTGTAASPKSTSPWKAAGKQYNTLRKEQLRHQTVAKDAYARYRQTGDPAALQQSRLAGVNRLRTKAAMYGVQAQALEAKAAAYAKAGKLDKANEYSTRAHKLTTRARKMSDAVDRFEAKLQNGQLKNPRVSARSAVEDGPMGGADGPDMDFTNDGPEMGGSAAQSVHQAMDGEGAPGVDGPQVRGIGSRQGKKIAKAMLSSGNVLGAVDTLKRMEAQGNRGGVMGLVDRYRKWSTKRRIMKDAYGMGKSAARTGDVELAQQSLHAISELGKPGWRTNHKIRTIANKAITGAKHAYKDHNPLQAKALLDLAYNVQMSMGRAKPTWRFRRVRSAAKSRLWKDVKRWAKDGNIEAFRAAVRLASAYAQEDGHKMTGKELGKLKKLTITAKKTSVVRALDDAKQLLKVGASPDEAQARLVYAMETADQLAKRGVTIKTGLFHRSIQGKFNKVRKMLVKTIQDGNVLETKKPGLFARWYKQGGGRTGLDIAPRPRTTRQVAQDRAAQREQQQMLAIQEALMSGQISPEQLPPEMLQQMGFQPPPPGYQ